MRQMPYGEKEEEPHMKTKRILSLLMAGALLTGALTGCGARRMILHRAVTTPV